MASSVATTPATMQHVISCHECHTPVEIDQKIVNLATSFASQRMASGHLPLEADDFIEISGNDLADTPGSVNLPEDMDERRRIIDAAITMFFDSLSKQTLINHPLCHSCNDLIASRIRTKLEQIDLEQRHLSQFLSGRSSAGLTPHGGGRLDQLFSSSPDALSTQSTLAQDVIDELKAEEERLLQEAAALEREALELQKISDDLDIEADLIDRQENILQFHLNRLQQDSEEFNDESDAIASLYAHYSMQLERLSACSVIQDAFHISVDGPDVASINGHRLGLFEKLSERNRDEINHALGHACLLLHILGQHFPFTFSRYKLCPFGSRSFLEVSLGSDAGGDSGGRRPAASEDGRKLDLFYPASFADKMKFRSSFNEALAAFLDCLDQLATEINRQISSGVGLPRSGSSGTGIAAAAAGGAPGSPERSQASPPPGTFTCLPHHFVIEKGHIDGRPIVFPNAITSFEKLSSTFLPSSSSSASGSASSGSLAGSSSGRRSNISNEEHEWNLALKSMLSMLKWAQLYVDHTRSRSLSTSAPSNVRHGGGA
ncbi:hypothetical protein H696_00039 [Fonticula alba]|uniref:Autophagy-related protein 6 n=1 Tax=Fonticula alba TaxID=691883 RepID=A0A058ZG54_FONAL|nr:hypothetical protein H696_00039 [Fonticula alba]KCV72447.1 hypothetical protein H696_00039 [Fonticula alba]|eukprot:XP_009492148.1 hypothetical protein H696_00039 [Fonticula alba]